LLAKLLPSESDDASACDLKRDLIATAGVEQVELEIGDLTADARRDLDRSDTVGLEDGPRVGKLERPVTRVVVFERLEWR
jgi:hypothetical protein